MPAGSPPRRLYAVQATQPIQRRDACASRPNMRTFTTLAMRRPRSSAGCHSSSSRPRHFSLASRPAQRRAKRMRATLASGAAATAAAPSGPRYSAAVATKSCWLANARPSRSTRSTPMAPRTHKASKEAFAWWLNETRWAPHAAFGSASQRAASTAPSCCCKTCRARLRAPARSSADAASGATRRGPAGGKGGNTTSTCTGGQPAGGASVLQRWTKGAVTAAPRARRARRCRLAKTHPSSPASADQG